MPRLVLTNVQMGDGRGPALRAVEAVIVRGSVRALAISGEHFRSRFAAPAPLCRVDPFSSPRLYACVAAAVMREVGARIGG